MLYIPHVILVVTTRGILLIVPRNVRKIVRTHVSSNFDVSNYNFCNMGCVLDGCNRISTKDNQVFLSRHLSGLFLFFSFLPFLCFFSFFVNFSFCFYIVIFRAQESQEVLESLLMALPKFSIVFVNLSEDYPRHEIICGMNKAVTFMYSLSSIT